MFDYLVIIVPTSGLRGEYSMTRYSNPACMWKSPTKLSVKNLMLGLLNNLMLNNLSDQVLPREKKKRKENRKKND